MWNILNNMGSIVMKCGSDIQGPQGRNPNDTGDGLIS